MSTQNTPGTDATPGKSVDFYYSADPEFKAKAKPPKKQTGPGGRDATSIPLPANVNQKRIYYSYLISFVVFHSLALLVFVPWFFSWTGIASLVIGSYLFGAVGIPITYHRLLTHRSFKTPKWFEHCLVVISLCNGQETPANNLQSRYAVARFARNAYSASTSPSAWRLRGKIIVPPSKENFKTSVRSGSLISSKSYLNGNERMLPSINSYDSWRLQ